MRCFKLILVSLFTFGLASAQAPPPPDAIESSSSSSITMALAETPLVAPPMTRFTQMKNMIKLQVNRAIDGKPYPSLTDGSPCPPARSSTYFFIALIRRAPLPTQLLTKRPTAPEAST